MKRSTNIAPLSLSTSYLIGSAFIGISMITLNSSGAFAPGVTLCRLMADVSTERRMVRGAPGRMVAPAGPGLADVRHPLTFAGLSDPGVIDRPPKNPAASPHGSNVERGRNSLDLHHHGALHRARLRPGRGRLRIRPAQLDPRPK